MYHKLKWWKSEYKAMLTRIYTITRKWLINIGSMNIGRQKWVKAPIQFLYSCEKRVHKQNHAANKQKIESVCGLITDNELPVVHIIVWGWGITSYLHSKWSEEARATKKKSGHWNSVCSKPIFRDYICILKESRKKNETIGRIISTISLRTHTYIKTHTWLSSL